MRNSLFPEVKLLLGPILFSALGVAILFGAKAVWHDGDMVGVFVLGGIALPVLALAYWSLGAAIKDLKGGRSKLAGRITGKSHHIVTTGSTHHSWSTIQVEGIGFEVSEVFEVSDKIYKWVNEGDEVLVNYWRRSHEVFRVDKNISANQETSGDTGP